MEGIIVLCAVVVLAALVVAHPQREHHSHHGNAGHQERQQNSRGSRVQYDSFDGKQCRIQIFYKLVIN